ncbi:MAG: hypothetical protein WCP77_16725 [Roseococcus sp.]|jgi:hypothetical protein
MLFKLGPGLEQARAQALAEVDRIAASRVAALGGSSPAHALKRDEATAYAALWSPDPASFPLLSAEVGITAPDLRGVARLVETKAAEWRLALAGIEAQRIAAKARLRAASTAPALREILHDFTHGETP